MGNGLWLMVDGTSLLPSRRGSRGATEDKLVDSWGEWLMVYGRWLMGFAARSLLRAPLLRRGAAESVALPEGGAGQPLLFTGY
jgi:hypothetical protein